MIRIKHNRIIILICLMNILVLHSNAQITCTSSGNWSGSAGWVPSIPGIGDNVTVALGCTLYVDISTAQINNLTINGVVIITNTATSILEMEGNLIVNSGASLINNGKLSFATAGNSFNLNGSAQYIHNPLNNNISDEEIFTNSNENFSNSSNLNIQKWSNGNVPLAGPTRVQSSIFGNVILNATVPGGTWDQDGYFSVPSLNRIRGSLTVSTGTIVMDDGTGSTTSLILQDVTVNGTGNIVFQRGYNRNYSLQVNNFSVNSIAPALPTVVMDTSFGILTMTVNGSMNLGYDFNAVYGSTYLSGADIRITVNGNMNITGGQVIFNNKASAPLLLNINGTTTLNNTSVGGTVCFVEGANGTLTVNSQDLLISGGSANFLYGRPGIIPAVKGTATFNISNDFIVNGASTTYLAYSDTNVSKVRVAIGRDFTLNGSNSLLAGAYTNGAFTFKVSRNFNHTNGQFIGQAYKSNISIDSIFTGANFLFNSGNASDYFKGNKSSGTTFIITLGNFSVLSSGNGYGQGYIGVDSSASNLNFQVSQNFIQNGGQYTGILSGSGSVTFTITGVLDVNGGICKIHNNTIYSNPGGITFSVGSLDYDGGVFSAFYSCNNNGLVGVFNIQGICKINFTNTGDDFSFIGLSTIGSDVNNLQLSLTVPNGITISGVNGSFYSSVALGAEIISLGSLNISNGTNSFNGKPAYSGSIGHFVSLAINGNVNITGGDTYLSAMSQTITVNLSGNINISNGSLSLKGAGTTNSTLNIVGGYDQTGGNFYLHNNVTDKMPEGSTITMNVNSNDDNIGNFNHTGGVFNFDNCSTTPASMTLILNIKSPNYTLGGTGQMTMTLPGTGNVYGILNFTHTGVTVYQRSGAHNIQQVRQNILSGCTLDVISGNMQLQSHNTAAIPPDALWVFTGGVLDLHSNSVYTNAIRPNSGVSVFGRVRTQNISGLYDGSTNAAFSTTLADNFDFYLAGSSTIEYYGVDNQIITGLGVGKALSTQHKYGNLEINFGGTPDAEFVYPTNFPNDSSVMVRANLLLTNGELNLDDDHDPVNGGGRWIILESGSTNAMTRTNGYIRSESENSNGRVKWNFNNTSGTHTFHFGYNSTNYIPLVFNHSSGSSIVVHASTYHTDVANLPLPPTVTHVNDNSGNDNSANTVDRFWFIQTSGNLPSANLTFNCTPMETGSITNLFAQRWVLPVPSWTNPPPGTQSSLSSGVQATNITTYNNWWTLSGNNNLLPIELIDFSGNCQENGILIQWQTATEINNAYFILEKSIDGNHWEEISQISGAGTSTNIQLYKFLDSDQNSSDTYYRLKQIDFDGRTAAFQAIKIRNCKFEGATKVSLSHSADGKAEVFVQSKNSQEFRLSILKIDGSLVMDILLRVSAGENIFPIPKNYISSGIYILRVSGKTEDFNFKLFVGN